MAEQAAVESSARVDGSPVEILGVPVSTLSLADTVRRGVAWALWSLSLVEVLASAVLLALNGSIFLLVYSLVGTLPSSEGALGILVGGIQTSLESPR